MKTLVEKYRKLLVEEESISGLDRSIALVESVVGLQVRWENGRFRGRRVSTDPSPIPDGLLANPEDLAFPELLRASARKRRKEEDAGSQARAVRTAFLLTALPPLAEADESYPADRYSLFFDSCLVLFHQAYFALLPQLHGRRWEHERQALLESFRRFAEHLPHASDRYNVLALYHDACQDHDRAGQFFRETLRATHSDAHEFMTTLQTYWGYLIEHQLLQEAFELLLDTYPRVARQDLEEVHGLMASTFELQRRHYEARLRPGRASRSGIGTLQPGTGEI
jgi:hypothetical protein